MRDVLAVLTALVLGAPTPGVKPDPLKAHMTILGITAGTSRAASVSGKLGQAKLLSNGGDAGASAATQCYEGPDGTTLVFVSNTELSGEDMAGYELAATASLAPFSGDEYYTVPMNRRPPCARLKNLTRATGTGGGLKLGMTPEQVRRKVGPPSEFGPNWMRFASDTSAQAKSKEEEAIFKESGPFATVRTLKLAFREGRVVLIKAYEGTSN